MSWSRGGGPGLLTAAAAVVVAIGLGIGTGSPVAFGNPSPTSSTSTSTTTSTTTTLPPLPDVLPVYTDGQPAPKLLSTAIELSSLGLDDSALAAAVSTTQAKLDADAETAQRADEDSAAAAAALQSAQAESAAAESAYEGMQASVRQAVVYLYTTGSDQLSVNPAAGPLLVYAQDYAESAISPYGVLDQRKAVEQDRADAERAARDAAGRQRAAAAKAEAARSDEQVQLQRLEAELTSASSKSAAAAVATDHLTLADQAGQEIQSAGTLQFTPAAPLPAPLSTTNVALTWAFAELGKQYVWGATGPDTFDCSGLTQYVWKAAGVTIPRVALDQDAWTVPVPLSDLLPGDLVFFGTQDIHHVGIYIGGGLMINAPHTGTVVQVSPIWWSDLAGFGRVHDGTTPVPPHMPPSTAQPAPASVVAGAGPVPSQTAPPVGWKPGQGSTTPILLNGTDPSLPTTTTTSTTSTTLAIDGTATTTTTSTDPALSTTTDTAVAGATTTTSDPLATVTTTSSSSTTIAP